MVSPCHALTARHIVFGDEQATLVDEHGQNNDFAVTLSIGNDGQGGPKWTIIADPILWGADNNGGGDFVLLHLRHCAGVDRTIGWMEWGKAEEKLDVKMTGVQGDKLFGTMWNSQGRIVEESLNHTYNHDLPTRHGSSGNPIYTTRLGSAPILRALNTGSRHDQADIQKFYRSNRSNTAIDAAYIYSLDVFKDEILYSVLWFSRSFPGRKNPQIEMSIRCLVPG